MRRILIIALLSLLLPISLFGQAGITVSPPRSYFNSLPGESITKKILVTNPSSTLTLELTVSLNDWKYDDNGNNVISEPRSLPTSLANWVSIKPQSYFSVAPGETKELEITVTPPKDIDKNLPVHTGMLYITQTNPVDAINDKGTEVKVSVKTGVKLYHRFSGERNSSIDFTDYKFDKKEKNLVLQLVNEGNVWTDGTIKTELVNQQNGSKIKIDDNIIYTTPGDKRNIEILLPKGLTTGKYIATSTFAYGDNNTIKMAELTFIYE